MKNAIQNFFNTAAGSWLKVFIISMSVLIIDHGDIYTMDYKSATNAALLSLLPAIINYFNPKDPRYGSNKLTTKK